MGVQTNVLQDKPIISTSRFELSCHILRVNQHQNNQINNDMKTLAWTKEQYGFSAFSQNQIANPSANKICVVMYGSAGCMSIS